MRVARVLRQRRLVQFNAQARLGRQRDVAVLRPQRLGHQFVRQRARVDEFLLLTRKIQHGNVALRLGQSTV